MAADPHAPALPQPVHTEEISSVRRAIRRSADLSIDEDVFCLGCGYNLRGLSGDPVTCPECGKLNSVADLVIPAYAIKEAQYRLETAPTICVGMSILGLISMFVAVMCFVQGTNIVYPVVFVAGSTGIGAWAVWRMRREFGARPGWLRILIEFHLVAAIVLTSIWIALGSLLAMPFSGLMGVPVIPWLILSAVFFMLGIAGLWFGLFVYRASRRRLATIQREASVRMAVDILRGQLGRTD